MIAYLKLAKWGLSIASAVSLLVLAKRALARLPMPACDESIHAIHHGGARDPGTLRLIVLHSTEGPSAISAAGWFASEASEGSAHIVVDEASCYRTLDDSIIPWGAKGDSANEIGLHLEMAGRALDDPKSGAKAFTREDWLAHRATLEKAAAVIQNWGREYGIPMKFLTAADLKRLGDSARGVTTHWELTKAYAVDSGHVDPGPAFPIDTFMKMTGGKAP